MLFRSIVHAGLAHIEHIHAGDSSVYQSVIAPPSVPNRQCKQKRVACLNTCGMSARTEFYEAAVNMTRRSGRISGSFFLAPAPGPGDIGPLAAPAGPPRRQIPLWRSKSNLQGAKSWSDNAGSDSAHLCMTGPKISSVDHFGPKMAARGPTLPRSDPLGRRIQPLGA